MTITMVSTQTGIACTGVGVVDAHCAEDVGAAIRMVEADGASRNVTIDFSAVSGCDAAGIKLLLELSAAVRRNNGVISFSALNAELRTTLRLLRLDRHIPFPTGAPRKEKKKSGARHKPE